MVKTAAKQECTAEGPGFESRLVHFYCSWGLLGCLFVPPRINLEPSGAPQGTPGAPQEPPGAPQEPPGAPQEPPRAARKAPRRGPRGPQERPWRAKGPRGGQNKQKPSWKQQNTVIYSVLLLGKQQNTVIYNVLWSKALFFLSPGRPKTLYFTCPRLRKSRKIRISAPGAGDPKKLQKTPKSANPPANPLAAHM